jgi:hexosaminidase
MHCSDRRGPTAPGALAGAGRRPRMLLVLLILLPSLPTAAAQAGAAVLAVPDAFVPEASSTRIVPTPQQETDLAAGFTLEPGTVIVLNHGTPALRYAVQELVSDIASRYGIELRVTDGSQGLAPGVPAITVDMLGPAPSGGEGATPGGTARPPTAGTGPSTASPVRHAEGYLLQVTPSGVTILGADERGTFYGVQSLRQLLGDTPKVRGVVVRDWPTVPWRFAMVYLDADSEAVNGKLLPILGELKFNAVLIMSDYLQWASAPELQVPQGATREAAVRLAATARENLLEPIPLLDTLSHSQWLFANGANRDLMADPSASRPFHYNPLDPATYDTIFPILDELVAIFHPRYLHIGHDEVGHVNAFPATPQQRAVGFGKLFLDDVTRIHDHLARLGVGTMIWGDTLLSDPVRPYWHDFPSDLVVAVWKYQAAGTYPEVDLAKRAGFRTLLASWSDPADILAVARAAHELHAAGTIQTRWTGYFGNATMLQGQYPQVYAYVTAAAAAWNPAATPPLGAPAWFRAAWFRATRLGHEHDRASSGALVDLTGVGNQPPASGFLGLDPDYALNELLRPGLRFGGVRYRLGSAVALRGQTRRAAGLPDRVSIPIGRTATALAFLHATGWFAPATGEPVGHYRVVYAGGSHLDIPLRYAVNIACWVQTEVDSIDLQQPWQGRTPNGLPVAVYQLIWTNPKPDVRIDRIEFVSSGGVANPVLFGLTLIG